MPTTQKPQQKQTKATQKVGGSTKKPVTKAMEGGSTKKPVTKAMEGGSTKKPVRKAVGGGKVVVVKSKATTRGGSAKGGSVKTSATKPRQHIGGGASKTVRRGPSIKKGGSDGKCYQVTTIKCGEDDCYKVTRCNSEDDTKKRSRLLNIIDKHLNNTNTNQQMIEKIYDGIATTYTIEQLQDYIDKNKISKQDANPQRMAEPKRMAEPQHRAEPQHSVKPTTIEQANAYWEQRAY